MIVDDNSRQRQMSFPSTDLIGEKERNVLPASMRLPRRRRDASASANAVNAEYSAQVLLTLLPLHLQSTSSSILSFLITATFGLLFGPYSEALVLLLCCAAAFLRCCPICVRSVILGICQFEHNKQTIGQIEFRCRRVCSLVSVHRWNICSCACGAVELGLQSSLTSHPG